MLDPTSSARGHPGRPERVNDLVWFHRAHAIGSGRRVQLFLLGDAADRLYAVLRQGRSRSPCPSARSSPLSTSIEAPGQALGWSALPSPTGYAREGGRNFRAVTFTRQDLHKIFDADPVIGYLS